MCVSMDSTAHSRRASTPAAVGLLRIGGSHVPGVSGLSVSSQCAVSVVAWPHDRLDQRTMSAACATHAVGPRRQACPGSTAWQHMCTHLLGPSLHAPWLRLRSFPPQARRVFLCGGTCCPCGGTPPSCTVTAGTAASALGACASSNQVASAMVTPSYGLSTTAHAKLSLGVLRSR